METGIVLAVLVIGTSIWAGSEAHRLKVSHDSSLAYNGVNMAFTWVLLCLLVWIIGFPYFLFRRSVALKSSI